MVKVSAVQMAISDTSYDANLGKVLYFMEQARDSDITCFPEVTLTGELMPGFEDVDALLRKVGEKAKSLQMWTIIGAYARRQGQTFNELYALDRDGSLVHTYQKMYPWRTEEGVSPGSRDQVPVIQTDFGKIGLLNCYDITFTEPVRRVVEAGAEILFFPANWFDKPRGDNPHYAGFPSSRSYEFLVPVVFCDMFDMRTTAHSQIVVPEKILAEASAEEIISADLDLSKRTAWKERFLGH